MFYPKNVPNIERALRIAFGIALIAFSLFNQTLSPLVIGLLWVSAATAILTGFVGWCPACALVGRKIKVNHPAENR